MGDGEEGGKDPMDALDQQVAASPVQSGPSVKALQIKVPEPSLQIFLGTLAWPAHAALAPPTMGLCGRKPQQVTPKADADTPKKVLKPPLLSRVNGWSLPLNMLQAVAWTTFLVLTITSFGIFIPLLPGFYRYLVYSLASGLFLFHFVVHMIAVSTDPAEPNVRIKNYNRPMPLFDRTKHKHVIQNQYCHLCEVTVSPKAKHCSACNKCITDFDHHCKWLNNCVGSRNYWFFFSSVASAVAGLVFLAMILLYVFIQYLMDQDQLRSDPHFRKIEDKETWLLFLPFFPVQTKAPVLLLIGVVALMLDLVSLLLLGHLLLFHFYLLIRRLSTFDYMTRGRQPVWKNSEKKKETSIQMTEGSLQHKDIQHEETTKCEVEKDAGKQSLIHRNGVMLTD
ncbi:palmitoyltransferase ZDHHC11-like [Tenrec ecaudatus]|uniref:palmitoyltransferase ZDHHC11-like n=1 Tax=Tenrec ecaudatus TaxID=94439 RepID=UPI003F5A8A87